MISALVFTCEHGGNRVPTRYEQLFRSKSAQHHLHSHRGYDIGALRTAKSLSKTFDAPIVYGEVTRLLVDLNRSVGHPNLFSTFSARLARSERDRVLEAYYFPHRQRVAASISQSIRDRGTTLHVAVHSFAPSIRGKTRKADIGLLYDPARRLERAFCARWKAQLTTADSMLRVRRNYPYRGRDDGLTTALRTQFGPRSYLGIELEINQALFADGVDPRQMSLLIGEALRRALNGCE